MADFSTTGSDFEDLGGLIQDAGRPPAAPGTPVADPATGGVPGLVAACRPRWAAGLGPGEPGHVTEAREMTAKRPAQQAG